jgi:hypothetical protein
MLHRRVFFFSDGRLVDCDGKRLVRFLFLCRDNGQDAIFQLRLDPFRCGVGQINTPAHRGQPSFPVKVVFLFLLGVFLFFDGDRQFALFKLQVDFLPFDAGKFRQNSVSLRRFLDVDLEGRPRQIAPDIRPVRKKVVKYVEEVFKTRRQCR